MSLSSDILLRAKDLFIKCGVKSVTMDDLAKGMGISKKTLYECIPSKAHLIDQIFHNHIKGEKKAITQIQHEAHDAVEEMVMIARYVTHMISMVSPAVVFEIKKYYFDSWNKLQKLNSEFVFHVIKSNLVNGIEQGLYRPEMDVEVIARHYVVLSTKIMDNELYPASAFSLDKIFKETINYHLRGITTPKGWEMYQKYQSKTNLSESIYK